MQRFYFQVVDDKDRQLNSGYFKANSLDDASDMIMTGLRSSGGVQSHLYLAEKGKEPMHVSTLAIFRAERG